MIWASALCSCCLAIQTFYWVLRVSVCVPWWHYLSKLARHLNIAKRQNLAVIYISTKEGLYEYLLNKNSKGIYTKL